MKTLKPGKFVPASTVEDEERVGDITSNNLLLTGIVYPAFFAFFLKAHSPFYFKILCVETYEGLEIEFLGEKLFQKYSAGKKNLHIYLAKKSLHEK